MVLEPFAVYAEGEGTPSANEPARTEEAAAEETTDLSEEDPVTTEASEEAVDSSDEEQTEQPDKEDAETVDHQSVETTDDQTVDENASIPDSKKRAAAAKAADDLGFEFEELNGSFITITGYNGSDVNVNIPSTIGEFIVQEIKEEAFRNNTEIKSVVVPASVTIIRHHAFAGCTSLESFVVNEAVEDGLTTISNNVFDGDTALESVSLPGSLTTIYAYTFKDCSSLREINLPDSITALGYRLFMNCSVLESVNYPMSLTSCPDGNGAYSGQHGGIFYGCNKIKEYTIPEGITELTGYFFNECSQLEKVTLPTTLTTVGEYAFTGCTGLTEMSVPANVRTIKWHAFAGCTGLTDVNLPEGLTTVYAYAFDGCTGLTEVSLPNSITTMGYRVFNNCTGLTSANYPLNWTKCPDGNGSYSGQYGNIFSGCSSLKSITIPEGIDTVVPYGLAGNSAFREIKIADSVTTIGEYAFSGDSGLRTITVPANVKTINWRAFEGCSGLTKVELPEGLLTVYAYAFTGCTGLKELELPDSIQTMGYRVFEGCTNLESINYPAGLANCPDGNGSYSGQYGNLFAGCSSLKRVTVPEGVTALPNYTFANCESLEKVFLPETLINIGKECFSGCTSMEQIWIGENVTSIGDNCFRNDSKLTIHGVSPSTAETYANNNNIPFSTEDIEKEQETLKGYVRDADGKGIAGVRVTVYDIVRGKSYGTVVTDESGAWIYTYAVKGREYSLIFNHPGYTLDKKNVRVTAVEGSLDVETVTGTKMMDTEEASPASDFTYSILNGINISITGYSGSDANVVIPSEIDGYVVQTIGSKVFQNNKNIVNVYVPDTVTTIGNYAFAGCTKLKHIGIGEAVTTISNNVFDGDTALESVSLPGSLTTIYAYTFKDCSSLREINLPDSITALGYRLFMNCSVLESVNYPMSLTSCPDGNGAYSGQHGGIFYGCNKIKEYTIPEGITELTGYFFNECSQLEKVTLPTTLTTVGEYAFTGCTGLTEMSVPANVRTIKWHAFAGCTGLTDVNLPEGLTTVYAYAFDGCTGLTEVSLPNSITTMGYRVFNNCTGLTSANYPLNWTKCPDGNGSYSGQYGNIFSGCSSLKSITIPEGIDTVVPYGLAGNSAFREIKIADSVTTIGEYAFSGDSGLRTITVPANVKTINWRAFEGCSGLTKVELPEGLLTVYAYAFTGCTGLKELELPDSIQTMGYRVFEGCTNLESINYPAGLANCPDGNGSYSGQYGNLFAGCSSLKRVTIPEGVTALPNYTFANCTYIRFLELPSTLKTIGKYAFSNCIGLPWLYLSNSVSEIQDGAFEECDGLINVTLPESVTTIGKNSFNNCPNLKCLYTTESLTNIGDKAVSGDKVTMYVVENSYAAEWAINNGINIEFIPGRSGNYENYAIDMTASSFYPMSESVRVDASVPVILDYKIKDEYADLIGDKSFAIRLSLNADVASNSITVDGKSVVIEESDEESELVIPVTANAGRIRFSIKANALGKISAYASFKYTKDGKSCSDLMGTILIDVPIITVEASSPTSLTTLTVKGLAESGKRVNIYINDTLETSAVAKKNGAYNAIVKVPSTVKDNSTFILTAKLADNPSCTASKQIFFSSATPELVRFDMYYMAHEQKMLDMLSVSGNNAVALSVFPGTELTFRIKYKNASKISKVYVVSTKNGVTKTMEATPCATEGEYIAKGYFDPSNHNYLPGKITVRYVLKGDADISTDYDNPQPLSTIGDIPDNVKDATTESEPIEGGTRYTVTLADENHSEFIVDNTVETTTHYTVDQLVADGFVKADETHYVKVEIDKYVQSPDDLKTIVSELVYDTTNNELHKFIVKKAIGKMEGAALAEFGLSDMMDIWGFAMDGEMALLNVAMTRFEIDCSNMSAAEKAAAYKKLDILIEYYGATLVVDYMIFAIGAATGIGLPLAILGKVLNDVITEYYTEVLNGQSPSLERVIGKVIGDYINVALKWLIDPSGYAYDTVPSNRVEGAIATVYFKETEDADPVVWDATEYEQQNPLYTDSAGCYAWDTPEGLWQVVIEKEGYETWTSEWLEVPPIQTDINAALVSTVQPVLEWCNVNPEGIQLKFSKYMDPETVEDVVIMDGSGNVIPFELVYSEEDTDASGKVYADTYQLKPTEGEYALKDSYTVVLPDTLKGANEAVSFKAEEVTKVCVPDCSLQADETATVKYGSKITVPVTVSPEDADITLNAVSGATHFVKVISINKTETAGVWDLILEGRLPGDTNVVVEVPDSGISTSIAVTVEMDETFEGFDDEVDPQEQAAVEAVIAAIEALPTVDELTLDDQDLVQAAASAYDALSEAAKAKVPENTKAALENARARIAQLIEEDEEAAQQAQQQADAVSATISALPTVENLTLNDKDAVQAAADAYDALSDAAKARVSAESKVALEAAKAKMAELVAEDTAAEEAAANVTVLINGLPSPDDLSLNNKDAVQAAADAYDALSDAAKAKVSADKVDALEAAKTKMAELVAEDAEAAGDAASVVDLIDALPDVDTLTLDDKDQVQQAVSAYNALSDLAKSKIAEETLNILNAAKIKIEELVDEDETAAEDAASVVALIDALPDVDTLTLDDQDQVQAAAGAYDALSDAAKDKVPAEKKNTLESARARITELIEADEEAAQQAQQQADAVAEKIGKLPSVDALTLNDKDAVQAAADAYDALSDAAKAKVPAAAVEALEAAKNRIAELEEQAGDDEAQEAADSVTEKISDLPSVDALTIGDQGKVQAALDAYNALSDAAKAKVPATAVEALEAAKKRMEELVKTDEEAAAEAETVENMISALPAADKITLADKNTVIAVVTAMDSLSDAAKAKISAEDIKKVSDAVARIDALEKAEKDKAEQERLKAQELINANNGIIDAKLPKVKISKPAAGKKKLTAKWKKLNSKQQKRIKGIEVEYSTDKNFKTAYKFKAAKKKAASVAIKKLKPKTTYYVRAHTYVIRGGVKYVSPWSARKKVKVK